MLFTAPLSYAAYQLNCDVSVLNDATSLFDSIFSIDIDMGGKEEEWVQTPPDQTLGWRVDFRYVESSYWVWGDDHTFDAHFYLDNRDDPEYELHGKAIWFGIGPTSSSYAIEGPAYNAWGV